MQEICIYRKESQSNQQMCDRHTYASMMKSSCYLLTLYLLFACLAGASYLEDVVNIDECRKILAFDAVEDFKTQQLSYRAYKQWPNLLPLQKAVYMADYSFVMNAKREFDALADVVEQSTLAIGISLPGLKRKWEEFTTETSIEKLFNDCNTAPDGALDWYEFLLCRSSYDQHGKPHDVAEFDLLETIVLHDFAQRLQDPRDPMTLELLARNEL